MNAIAKTVAVIVTAHVIKFGILMLIGKAAEREENRLRQQRYNTINNSKK